MRAVEFLIPLSVLVGELDGKLDVRAVKTRVGVYLSTAAPEDTLQVRYALRKKSNISPAGRLHQQAFNNGLGTASYTFHKVITFNPNFVSQYRTAAG